MRGAKEVGGILDSGGAEVCEILPCQFNPGRFFHHRFKGEAQKIAIARALYKDAPFIILDEPTAALDPISKAEIYSKFNDIADDKAAIYISHHLSSCKFCDETAVFHEGGVIQHGTYAELVADETGKYHELWNAQAQYYADKTA